MHAGSGSTASRYAKLFVFPVLMVVIMIATYIPAMRSPQPHEMPIGLVGIPAADQSTVADIINASGSRYAFRTFDDADSALAAVQDQSVAAAMVFAPTEEELHRGSDSRAVPAISEADRSHAAAVYIASATGSTRTTAALLPIQNLALELGVPLVVRDLVPLKAEDSAGVSSMFFALAATLAGFISITTLGAAAPKLLAVKPLAVTLVLFGSVATLWIWIMARVIIGAVRGPFLPLFVTGVLTVMAAGFAAAFFTKLIGPLSVLLSLFVFVALGTTASGVSVPMDLAPGFYRLAHEVLTFPATSQAILRIMYFDGAGVWSAWLVLGIWIAVMAGALAVMNRRKTPRETAAAVRVRADASASPEPAS